MIAIAIVAIVIGGVTVSVVSHFRLQRHRADAVAMASYRKLAEEAVANQQSLHRELEQIKTQMAAVEQMLRGIG